MQRVITLLCIGVFLYSAYELSSIFLGYYHNRNVLAEAQDVYYENMDTETKEEGGMRSSFVQLQKLNPDIVGWITVEGTMIDYPILQAKDNDYYLFRNYKKEDTKAGSIFMDYRNDITVPTRHTILYGHRMKDGSMFGNLKNYLQEDFFRENRNLYYDNLYEGYDLEVFSVYTTTTEFYYIQTDFQNDEEYGGFLQRIQQRSLFDAGVSLTPADRIITFSTCDYDLDPTEGRLVVHAKLVERK
ncbi:class B sortase [Priestia taiwanensis]|uniref:SrtB family sortase n=1 Tax=Priestia taiwanensis TaxID=1347902 RepID=A0A917ENZ2_9BACI|nr:class B sortase [Priestia taiwanensis]GGE69016.1 SrtB family sortase [Priestia taiwanensis]